MVEFLLLVAPILTLMSLTITLAWLGHAKTQLRVLATEGALIAAQPDTARSEIEAAIDQKFRAGFGSSAKSVNIDSANGISEVEIAVDRFDDSFGFLIPNFRITAYAANEI